MLNGKSKTRIHGGPGTIEYEIIYSSRTWGADIENLLRNYIGSLIEPISTPWRDFLNKNENTLTVALGIAFLGVALKASYSLFDNFVTKFSVTSYEKAIAAGAESLQRLELGLRFLLERLFGPFFIYAVLGSLIAVAILGFISFTLANKVVSFPPTLPPSFLRLTRSADNYRNQALKVFDRRWSLQITTFVVAVVASITANIISWWFLN
jgi:hypothetical protein